VTGKDGNPDGVIPGMVLGGAPNAKLAPMGDIYFSFDFSKQFGYLLTNEWGVNVTSNSYGSSDLDNDGMDASSQEADIIHAAVGGQTVTPTVKAILKSSANDLGYDGFVQGAVPVASAGRRRAARTRSGSRLTA